MIETIRVIKGDITELYSDESLVWTDNRTAIANAANGKLKLGSGVAGAIRDKGGPTIQTECDEIVAKRGRVRVGEAVATKAGNLFAGHVIHAVTMKRGGGSTDADSIAKATRSTIKVARKLGCETVALPAFGTGVGGFPVDECAKVMVAEVRKLRKPFFGLGAKNLKEVIFSVFDDEAENAFRIEMGTSGLTLAG